MAEITYSQVWNSMLGAVDPNVIQATNPDYPDWTGFIPADDGNKDWRAYQAWLAEGNEPNPPPGSPAAPIEQPK